MKPRLRWTVAVMVSCALIAGCRTEDDPDSTVPRIVGDTLVAIVVTTTIAPSTPDSYTIEQGDTLSAIAERFHLDVDDLASSNGITDLDDIEAGQTLTIPAPSPTSAAATTSATT